MFEQAGWYILLVLLLMPLNWFLETCKWYGFLRIHVPVSFRKAFIAVTGGIALSLFTPNRIGEYGGRMLYLPYAYRWPVVMSTLMGSVSQNIAAFATGVIACIILFKGFMLLKIMACVLVILSVLSLFYLKKIVSVVCRLQIHPFLKKLSNQLSHIEEYPVGLLIRSLFFAFARYGVYAIQFVLLLKAFEPQVSPGVLFLGVSGLYLFQSLVPMPPVADVLARTNLAIILWSGTGMSELSISLASLIVWIINLLLPAILGSIALGTTKAKKSFNTHDQSFDPALEPVLAQPTNQPSGSPSRA